ncbi:hypothetical protein OC844_005862 [Tilletia horrida]|nr:hypothetical protein OC844_005862 [Tilletia horrida]
MASSRIYIKPDPDGRTPHDAISLSSDSDSSDDPDFPKIRKNPSAAGPSSSSAGNQSAAGGAAAAAAAAAVAASAAGPSSAPLDPNEDPTAPDWQRATYNASQRAYADLVHYYRTGNAYFVSLSTTPWESSQDPVDILDMGWAYLRESPSSDPKRGFDWSRHLHTSSNSSGLPVTDETYQTAKKVCTALHPPGALTAWHPHVVYYQPFEANDCFNEFHLPNHKNLFSFGAFADRVRPPRDPVTKKPKSNVFMRNISGTHFDRQVEVIREFNYFLDKLSQKKPVFLLTHCMREDVMFLNKLGIAWQSMNLSYPLSPWFTPADDAEWLKTHRYWSSAWDFARPSLPQQGGEDHSIAAASGALPSSSSAARRGRAERPHSRDERESAYSRGRDVSSDEDRERYRNGRERHHASRSANRQRFTAQNIGRDGESEDEVAGPDFGRRRETFPRPPKQVSQRDFYRVGSIHLVDLYALIDVMPRFSERSASYYPSPSQTGGHADSQAQKKVAREEKEKLKERRQVRAERANNLMNGLARTQKQRDTLIHSLQATSIRAGVLDDGDGAGEQYKWWNAGNEAMFMLAVLGKLVAEHPLPDVPLPPTRHRARDSRARDTSRNSSALVPPSKQREARTAEKQRQQAGEERPARLSAPASRPQPASNSGPPRARAPPHPLPARPAVPTAPAATNLRRGEQPRNAAPDSFQVPITASGSAPSRPSSAATAGPSSSTRVPASAARRADPVRPHGPPAPASNGRIQLIPPSQQNLPQRVQLIPPSQQNLPQRAQALEPVSPARGTGGSVSQASTPTRRALPQPITAPAPQLSMTSSELSSLESEDYVEPVRKRPRTLDRSSSEDDEDEDNDREVDDQFGPFYSFLHEIFAKPAIFISFAFRDGSPRDRNVITEVGYSVLDASKADLRESLKIDTRHYLVKEYAQMARPDARTDFAFAPAKAGASGADQPRTAAQPLPSGTYVANKRNITKHLHSVLKKALETDRRVFAVISNADDTSFGHQSIIGPENWPAFYDWRTRHFSARGADDESMFRSANLISRYLQVLSPSSRGSTVPGISGRKIYTVEVKNLFAAVNPEKESEGGGGQGAVPKNKRSRGSREGGYLDNEIVVPPFPQLCELLGLKPNEAGHSLENPGNLSNYCMQAMLEFAYGPADRDEFTQTIRSRKEALEARAVDAQV